MLMQLMRRMEMGLMRGMTVDRGAAAGLSQLDCQDPAVGVSGGRAALRVGHRRLVDGLSDHQSSSVCGSHRQQAVLVNAECH